MARRYLGYGVTNNSGVATLDHAPDGTTLSHSYTGVGAGKIDVVAESGTLQSEIYNVIDGTFVDIATTGKKNTNWNNGDNLTISEPTDTGTTISSPYDSVKQYWANNNNLFSTDFAIEFDIVSFDDNLYPSVRVYGNSSNDFVLYFTGQGGEAWKMNCNQGSHVKIMVTNGRLKYQVDNRSVVDFEEVTVTTLKFGFRFRNVCSIKYKNFVVYPI